MRRNQLADAYPAAHPPRLSRQRTTALPRRTAKIRQQLQFGVDGIGVAHESNWPPIASIGTSKDGNLAIGHNGYTVGRLASEPYRPTLGRCEKQELTVMSGTDKAE